MGTTEERNIAVSRGLGTRYVPIPLEVAYISGPMSGREGSNYALFGKVATRLRKCGYFVLTPHEGGPDEATCLAHAEEHGVRDFRETPMYATLMKRDVGYVLMSNILFMLPGHFDSRGAAVERSVGIICGKKVIEIQGDEQWDWLLSE